MFQKKNPKKLALNLSSSTLSCKSVNSSSSSSSISISSTNTYKKPKVSHDNSSAFSSYHAGPVRILSNLYLGAAHNAQDLYQLKTCSISTIINVASEITKPTTIPCNIDYHHFRWTHHQDNLASLEFERAIDLIKAAHFKNHTVLVHCQQGIERSAALIIAYLVHMSRRPRLLSASSVHINQDDKLNAITSQSLAGRNWSLDYAISFVKERAKGIRPNLSEMYQLHEYDKMLPFNDIKQSRPSIQTRTRRSESISTCEPTFINPIKPLTVDTHYGQRRPRATSFRDVSNRSLPSFATNTTTTTKAAAAAPTTATTTLITPKQQHQSLSFSDSDKLAAATFLIVLFVMWHKENRLSSFYNTTLAN